MGVSPIETMQIVTGCLKPKPTDKLYQVLGTAPADVRRRVVAEKERYKQQADLRHPMYGHKPHPP